ncbi:MAG: hypothetical protein AAF171_20520 [Cyanobacteria bacterium P01_A01_bin.116]
MRALFKISLAVLAGLVVAESAVSRPAIAGSRGVTLPGSGSSGVSDNFGPDTVDTRQPTTVEREAVNTLDSFKDRSEVPALDGEALPISPEQIAKLESSLSGTGDLEANLLALQQQLEVELGGSGVEVTRVSNSPSDVRAAVDSVNDLIMNLDSEALAAALDSPTFTSIVRLLRDAIETVNSDPSIEFEEGDNDFGLLNLRAAREEVIPVEPEVTPEEENLDELDSDSAPEVESAPPATREPVRGLW